MLNRFIVLNDKNAIEITSHETCSMDKWLRNNPVNGSMFVNGSYNQRPRLDSFQVVDGHVCRTTTTPIHKNVITRWLQMPYVVALKINFKKFIKFSQIESIALLLLRISNWSKYCELSKYFSHITNQQVVVMLTENKELKSRVDKKNEYFICSDINVDFG